MRRAHQVNAAIFDDECGRFGITHTQYGLLMAIATYPELDVVSAARLTAIDRTSAHVAIGNLERRGWIKRRPDPNDRRRHLLTVTRAGWDLLRRTKAALERVKHRIFALLTAAEARTFVKILNRIVDEGGAATSKGTRAYRPISARSAPSTPGRRR